MLLMESTSTTMLMIVTTRTLKELPMMTTGTLKELPTMTTRTLKELPTMTEVMPRTMMRLMIVLMISTLQSGCD